MRPRGSGAVYPYRKGYAGQVDLGLVDGKRKRVTVYGRTRRIAETKVKELLRALDEHGDLPTENVTVEKWLTYWLDNIAARRLKPNTFRSYRTVVKQYLIPALGKKTANKLTAAHLRELRDYIVETKGKSPTTAHNAHRILSVALNDGVRDNRLTRNAARAEHAPPKAEPTRAAMLAEDAVKVLRVASVDRLGERWPTALLTGMRQGERLGLRWSHLDLTEGKADLAWALQRVPYRHGCNPSCGKRPASCPQRTLAIPAHMAKHSLGGNFVLMRPKTKGSTRVVALIEPLRLVLQRRYAVYLAERGNYATDHDLVFCNPDGSPIDPKKDGADWKDALTRAQVPLVTGHEARHTTATLLLQLGASQHVVEQILGHTQAATTQAYQHVSLEMQRQALDGLGRLLELGDLQT